MAGDELVRRVAVAMLAPALGEHVLVLRLQHREPADFFEVAGKAGFGRQDRQCCRTGHDSALLTLCPRLRRAIVRRRSSSRRRKSWVRWRNPIAGAAYTDGRVEGSVQPVTSA